MLEEWNIPIHTELSNSDVFLSVVVSTINEEEVLPEFHSRKSSVLESISAETEIIFLNDASTDSSLTG